MVQKKDDNLAYQQGLFRYKVLADLLACPPGAGELAKMLREIASRKHVQPWDRREITVTIRTLERWYAKARKSQKPTEALQPKLRSDRGAIRTLGANHCDWLNTYCMKYPSWSVQLLYDNLHAMGFSPPPPSYSTVLRYLKAHGYPVFNRGIKRYKQREIRSFEVEFVGQMWHMDFHKGSRMVVTENGQFVQPICMAIVDDKSRLVCHVQWFLNETAEVLVHGFIQAVLKRGMPRTFYSDNGSAMKAEEFITGLEVLGIKRENTLPYAAYQNGKQESFWQPLEGRLIKMLPKDKRITLEVLNRATQAWVEQDYHVRTHSETKETPLHRFFNAANVLRPSLPFDDLKKSFRMYVNRKVRKTDGTVTIDGVRFTIPNCYSHFSELKLRYARWDLGEAEIICPSTHKSLCSILPLNKLANSSGARNVIAKVAIDEAEIETMANKESNLDLSSDHLPPLLAQCLKKHAETFPNAGYLPLTRKDINT